MKRFIFVAILLLTCHQLMAAEWRAFEMWNQSDGTRSNSLTIIYQGQFIDPAKEIIEMSEKVDRSTPENLLKSLFWAVNHLNPSAYNALFAPGEIKNQFLADPEFKWTGLTLRRQLQYGDYTILELEATYSTNRTVMLWPVRKIGQDYYASEKLDGTDATYNFLNYYYAFSPMIGMPNEQELPNVNFGIKGYVYITNNVTKNVGSPLIFRFQGRYFDTNSIIDKWPTRLDQDLSSPAGTLASTVAALNSGDVERYSALLDPIERTNILRGGSDLAVGRTWDEWMRSNFKDESKYQRPTAIRLDKEVVYTDNALALVYEDANSKLGARRDLLYFKKNGTNWFISHKMEETANLFPDYLGFSKYMETKMFPHFDPVR